eukprot:CAMPEP_0170516966 /NCGR_PEP_ID=MMETSP0209-20121228/3074_1 /TAXON_ID=665100 ORGANISM="Litonotus pictus, Strain P1" /NCGR_SAMPLE_ID=MMETSP0209 /ASSEMBLY_ACC=CAM_ASM_000301 /LENGTH=285 /DNA_ID=CAMNT_0010802071 /DNA_START=416 /DNA_END=1273 /DNA_ORIENTATION=+
MNPKQNDLLSLINNFFYQLSFIYFNCLLLEYVIIIINNYYYLELKKLDYLLPRSFGFFEQCYYFVFIVLTLTLAILKEYLLQYYLISLINGFVKVIISVLLFYYSIKLFGFHRKKCLNKALESNHREYNMEKDEFNSNMYSTNSNNLIESECNAQGVSPIIQPYEAAPVIGLRMVAVKIVPSLIHFFIGVTMFVLGINYTGRPYYLFINPNLYDFLVLFFGHYVCGLLISYNKVSSKVIPRKTEFLEDREDNYPLEERLLVSTQEETDDRRNRRMLIKELKKLYK